MCSGQPQIKHRSSRYNRAPAAPCSCACSLAETRLGAPSRRFPRGCSGQPAELPSRRCGSRSRVGPKHFRCPRQRSSTVSVRPTHLPDTAAEGHGPSSGFSMPPQRRTYSKSFEAQVIQECSEPGASIANIALGYKHRPPFAGSLPPEPHAELFHLVVAGLRSVRQAQVLVFLLDRVVSDRVHPGNGIHELPRSLSLAGSSQPGCPDGYAGPRPVAAPRSAAAMKRVLMPHCAAR